MNPPGNPAEAYTAVAASLRRHLELCGELLAVVEREHQDFRPGGTPKFEGAVAKKNLLPRLNQSLDQLRQHRAWWQRLSPAERAQQKEIASLLRQNQELIMRILVLDRENEQLLLRQGMVPPQHLPSVNRQRPHYVAGLYRRGTSA